MNSATPKTGSVKGSSAVGSGNAVNPANSHAYYSAKVGSHQSATLGNNKDRAASCNQFDHQQELNGQRMLEDQTFGNQGSKRSLLDNDEILMKITEAGIGNAIGEENAIIRPSGSHTSLKQQKEDENVAPSNSTVNDDAASANNLLPLSSTAIQSSFTNAPKQDSQQQT